MSHVLISNIELWLIFYKSLSLFQDILKNEDFSLDAMFISSLVSDLLKVRTQHCFVGYCMYKSKKVVLWSPVQTNMGFVYLYKIYSR